MFSKSVPDGPWSLTRRLALLFAGVTCGLMILQAAWSSWFVFRLIREDTRKLLQHELQEVLLQIDPGADTATWTLALESAAGVFEDPVCAIRLRRDGLIVSTAGRQPLLDAVPEPIFADTSWQNWLFSRGVAVGAMDSEDQSLRLEVILDGSSALESLTFYAKAALIGLLVSCAFAAVGGWLAARRGMAGLRQVVRQAALIDPLTRREYIRVEDAPLEVREVGEALNELLARIDVSSGHIRTFTASLAHELRSPLMNLIGETEVALMSRREPDEYEALLSSHLEEMHELADAVGNLVAYCRHTEPRGLTPQLEPFDLADEAELRLERERRRAERLDVNLVFETRGETTVTADRESYLRVLRNLVGNALDWSPAGTEVTVSLTGEDDAVALDVKDRGPGVPAAQRTRIFEPFVSGRSQQGRRSGYGLGLAICRSILTSHGGTLVYEARKGGGSRFAARFPRKAQLEEDERTARRARILAHG